MHGPLGTMLQEHVPDKGNVVSFGSTVDGTMYAMTNQAQLGTYALFLLYVTSNSSN